MRIGSSSSAITIFNMTTRPTEGRPVVSEKLQVADAVFQETRFGGDEEVKQDTVVEGQGAEQKYEMTVRVATPDANL